MSQGSGHESWFMSQGSGHESRLCYKLYSVPLENLDWSEKDQSKLILSNTSFVFKATLLDMDIVIYIYSLLHQINNRLL